MANPLENCPARLARFRLELGTVAPDDGTRSATMLAEPHLPLPCVESAERPGRCVHCQQPTLQGAGEPHGPFCTSIDAGCRECKRLQTEARRAAGKAQLPELTPAVLEAWRSDADRWAREHSTGFSAVATQRIATLIDALIEARAAATEVSSLALDKASELETRLEAIRLELRALNEKQNRAEALRVELFGPPKRPH